MNRWPAPGRLPQQLLEIPASVPQAFERAADSFAQAIPLDQQNVGSGRPRDAGLVTERVVERTRRRNNRAAHAAPQQDLPHLRRISVSHSD